MKKAIALLLALSMCFALCGCGKSKEAMIDEAITISCDELYEQYESNAASAKDSYEKQYINTEIQLTYIGEDCAYGFDIHGIAEFGVVPDYQAPFVYAYAYIYFNDNDVLKTLIKGCNYEIVGEIHFNDEGKLEITNAYLV